VSTTFWHRSGRVRISISKCIDRRPHLRSKTLDERIELGVDKSFDALLDGDGERVDVVVTGCWGWG
jgi:hypothetical protein